MLAALSFLLVATLPFLWHALRRNSSFRLHKIAFYTAFSGELYARGQDQYRAAQIAVSRANTSAPIEQYYTITAVDDTGHASRAAIVAPIASEDPAINSVVCCSTEPALQAVLKLLRNGQHLYSLLIPAPSPSLTVQLATQRFFLGKVLILHTSSTSHYVTTLASAFRAKGWVAAVQSVSLSSGTPPDVIAAQATSAHPTLIYLDTSYPDAATLALALRAAGVTAPILGDARLDGVVPTNLLRSVIDWWYIAPDRNKLLALAGPGFLSAFTQAAGHPPSDWDIVAFLQTQAALDHHTPLYLASISQVLYQGSSVYPREPVQQEQGKVFSPS